MCPDSAKHLSRKNFRVGAWQVRPSEGTVSHRGETRHLEPKIMDLLVYLADHPTEVVSKEEIFRAVWSDTHVTDVALTRTVSELRTVLGDDAKDPRFIETIPKRGYRLIAPVGKTAPRSRIFIQAASAALVIALVGTAVYFLRPIEQDAPNDASIAVLPFESLNDDRSNEYFSAGITEDVITHLSKIEGIRVVSRTTVMKYRDSERDLPEIARELGVATILEGSVRLEKDRVRITSQLIDAKADAHLWAETYDRSLDDMFEIQTDVALRIAAAMEVRLSPEERTLLGKAPTEDFQAYDAYLKARDYYRRYRYNDNENAIELFKKSIAIDPDFALAYAGLADAYNQRVNTWGVDGKWSDVALETAQKSISIDPELAEGYKALAFSYSNKGWLTKALESYEKALALRPRYEAVMLNTAVVLHRLGRWDEALIWMKRRLQWGPGNAIAYTNTAEILNDLGFRDEATLWLDQALAAEPYYFDAHKHFVYREVFEGQAEAARNRMDNLLKVHPNTVGALLVAGEMELFGGNSKQAMVFFERALESSQGTNVYAHLRLGDLLWRIGERSEAEQHLAYVEQECRDGIASESERWFHRWALAVSAAVQGDKAEALDWLGKSIEMGRLYYGWDQREPAFENLREQTEFQQLMDQMRTKTEKLRQHVRTMAERGELRLTP